MSPIRVMCGDSCDLDMDHATAAERLQDRWQVATDATTDKASRAVAP